MDRVSHLHKVLIQQGLSEEEVSCYLTVLRARAMSALDISRKSRVPRTSSYRALDSLIARGLVSEETRNRRTVYIAEHPSALLYEVRAKESLLADSMPLFEQMLREHPTDPSTRVYTGQKGFSAAFESFYDYVQRERIKQIHSLSHPDLIQRYPRVFARAVERREKLKVYMFLMMPATVPHSRSPLLSRNSFRDIRYIPQRFAQNTSMLIGGSTVLYVSFHDRSDTSAIVVDSAAIANLLREFFKLVWDRVAVPQR